MAIPDQIPWQEQASYDHSHSLRTILYFIIGIPGSQKRIARAKALTDKGIQLVQS
jgi:hypothetical protein